MFCSLNDMTIRFSREKYITYSDHSPKKKLHFPKSTLTPLTAQLVNFSNSTPLRDKDSINIDGILPKQNAVCHQFVEATKIK